MSSKDGALQKWEPTKNARNPAPVLLSNQYRQLILRLQNDSKFCTTTPQSAHEKGGGASPCVQSAFALYTNTSTAPHRSFQGFTGRRYSNTQDDSSSTASVRRKKGVRENEGERLSHRTRSKYLLTMTTGACPMQRCPPIFILGPSCPTTTIEKHANPGLVSSISRSVQRFVLTLWDVKRCFGRRHSMYRTGP